jgi:hypothetical protein
MAKIKLGVRPEAFKPFPVKYTMPDGTEDSITATFRYRTQEEYGRLLNESKTPEGQALPMDANGAIEFVAHYENANKANAEFLMKALTAWDLDEPLTAEKLQALGNEAPAAIIALTAAYGTACREGRLGN